MPIVGIPVFYNINYKSRYYQKRGFIDKGKEI